MNEDYLLSRRRIFNATFLVVLAILLSKISGLVRDQMMAGYFGMTFDTDAFIWADYIPNLFRVLFAESLIIAAFIPIYSAYLKRNQKDDLKIFVNSVVNIMVVVFLVISAVIFILSPEIGAILSKITNNQLDVYKFMVMNRIMIFSLVLMSLSGLTTGILNSHNIFTVPSLAPFVMNVITIISVAMLFQHLGIYSMAIGIMAGSLMHLVIQLPQIKVAPLKYRFAINFKHKGVREILSLMLPILLSLGAVQLNNSVDYFFALNLGGGNTTALTLSWRVANLPLGVFSVAIVTVLYPLMSRQAAGDDIKGIKESFSLGVREIGYMMIPATAGLVILSYPIIKVLFERYNFGPVDTKKVAYILIFHSLGLIFFGLLMILNRMFYAFKNVKTPLKIASFSIIVNLILDWILINFMGVGGLALSTSLVALCNVVILVVILRKKIGNFGGRRIFVSYGKIFASAAVMSAVLYFLWGWLKNFAYQGRPWLLILLLFLAIVAGAGIYIVCTILFKMEEVKFAVGLFKKLKKNT
ncbi:MAG: murein biosynthesis integral membrane protein MurJ [Actinobacteria bacterium]|nr:murein biosynthesis integral membrane protein MurJ [Actinomycetota bacterium]